MFGDTIFSFLFETLSGSMPDRKSHAHVPILRDPPMIPLCDGPAAAGYLAGDLRHWAVALAAELHAVLQDCQAVRNPMPFSQKRRPGLDLALARRLQGRSPRGIVSDAAATAGWQA